MEASRRLRIAALQTRPRPDFDSALDEALRLAERAVDEGAQMLALPEYCGGLRTEGAALVPPAAVEEDHPVLLSLQRFAAEKAVWIIVGSIAVPGPDGRIINRGFVLDDDGRIVARYDKLHLFDVSLSSDQTYEESANVSPGSHAVVVDTPHARLGYSICYDLRFPQLYRDLAQAGAEILLVPSAFTRRTGEAHWHVLNRARAIENGAWVIAPCAIGDVPGGGSCYGHSLIIDPWGRVIADGGDKPGVVSAVIDIGQVVETRRQIASLSHDRRYTLQAGVVETNGQKAGVSQT